MFRKRFVVELHTTPLSSKASFLWEAKTLNKGEAVLIGDSQCKPNADELNLLAIEKCRCHGHGWRVCVHVCPEKRRMRLPGETMHELLLTTRKRHELWTV